MLKEKISGFVRKDDRKYEKTFEIIIKLIRKIIIKVRIEKVFDDIIILVPRYKKYNYIFSKVISYQIKRYIKKLNITELIFEDDLEILKSIFETYSFIDEKILMRNCVVKIFNHIFNINKQNINMENVYILVNVYNKQNIYLIDQLVEIFKTVNIITENISKYRRLEERYFSQGVLITVSNNKRKSLKNCRYIINIDFDKKRILRYNIKPNSIIVNLSKENLIIEKGFDGIIINSFEVDINKDKEIFIKEFYGCINKNIFLENILKRNIDKLDFFNIINQEYYTRINALIGVRGIIQNNEFLV